MSHSGQQYLLILSCSGILNSIFEAVSGATASLHTTLTQWKNHFEFEVFGDEGYIKIEGLGSSYGVEKLIYGKRDFKGPFANKITEYRRGDISWKQEWLEFTEAIKNEPNNA